MSMADLCTILNFALDVAIAAGSNPARNILSSVGKWLTHTAEVKTLYQLLHI